MRGFLFATARNHKFKKDGDEFVREMYKCANYHQFMESNILTHECDEKKYSKRRKDFLDHLDFNDLIILFCHGGKKWIYGAGFHLWNITKLAWEIKAKMNPKALELTTVHIILYACSCGKGKGNKYPVDGVPNKAGVAMLLCNELVELGVKAEVIAHTTKGHTTRNPYCVKIYEDAENNICKEFFVPRVTRWQGKKDPIGRKRWLKWIKLLKIDPTFRFEFPFLTKEQLHKILDKEDEKN